MKKSLCFFILALSLCFIKVPFAFSNVFYEGNGDVKENTNPYFAFDNSGEGDFPFVSSEGFGRVDINLEVRNWSQNMQVYVDIIDSDKIPSSTEFYYIKDKKDIKIDDNISDGFWLPQDALEVMQGSEDEFCDFSITTKVFEICTVSLQVYICEGNDLSKKLLTTSKPHTINFVEEKRSYQIKTTLTNMVYEGPEGNERNRIKEGDIFTLNAPEGLESEKMRMINASSSGFKFEIVEEPGVEPLLPIKVLVKSIDPNAGLLEFWGEAYVIVEDGAVAYYYDPKKEEILVAGFYNGGDGSTLTLKSEVKYKELNYRLKKISGLYSSSMNVNLVLPESITEIIGSGISGDNWKSVEFKSESVPYCVEGSVDLPDDCVIIVPNQKAKEAFSKNSVLGKYNIKIKDEIVVDENVKFSYVYGNNTKKGSVTISYNGKPFASYDTIPEGVTEITLKANPLIGYKLKGEIIVVEGDDEIGVPDGGKYELKGEKSITIRASFEKDDSQSEELENAIKNAIDIVDDISKVDVVESVVVVGANEAFGVSGDQNVQIMSDSFDEGVNDIIDEVDIENKDDFKNIAYNVYPIVKIGNEEISEVNVKNGAEVSMLIAYPEELTEENIVDLLVIHKTSNGKIEIFSEENRNLEFKDGFICLNGVKSFSPFVILYKEKAVEPPVIISYHNLNIIKSEGAKLVSRYDKKRTPDGGSFTLSLVMEEGYEDKSPVVYYKRGRFGDWKELSLDEVSGYYQIRNVYTDIYVKVSGDGIWPVSNEKIEGNKVIVSSSDGCIKVTTDGRTIVRIYSISGTMLYDKYVEGYDEFSINGTGVYLVRVADKVYKVNIK